MSLLSFKRPKVRYPIKEEFRPHSEFYNPIRNIKLAGWIGSLFKAPKRLFKDKDIKVTREMVKSYEVANLNFLFTSPIPLREKRLALCISTVADLYSVQGSIIIIFVKNTVLTCSARRSSSITV